MEMSVNLTECGCGGHKEAVDPLVYVYLIANMFLKSNETYFFSTAYLFNKQPLFCLRNILDS